MITHYARQAIPPDEMPHRPDRPAPLRSPGFDAILERIAQATEWEGLRAVLNGVDEHFKQLSLTPEEIELINRNAVLKSKKIPEHPTEVYADEQMELRKAMRKRASIAA